MHLKILERAYVNIQNSQYVSTARAAAHPHTARRHVSLDTALLRSLSTPQTTHMYKSRGARGVSRAARPCRLEGGLGLARPLGAASAAAPHSPARLRWSRVAPHRASDRGHACPRGARHRPPPTHATHIHTSSSSPCGLGQRSVGYTLSSFGTYMHMKTRDRKEARHLSTPTCKRPLTDRCCKPHHQCICRMVPSFRTLDVVGSGANIRDQSVGDLACVPAVAAAKPIRGREVLSLHRRKVGIWSR